MKKFRVLLTATAQVNQWVDVEAESADQAGDFAINMETYNDGVWHYNELIEDTVEVVDVYEQ